jgi:hypothetical protein
VLVLCGLVLAGCSQQKMDMSSMKPPVRAAELDMLEPMVGNWSFTGEMKMPDGKVIKNSGTSSSAWECDRRVLVERAEEQMEGMPEKNYSFAIYTWNPDKKAFNTHYINSMGHESHGMMTYDPATKIYHMTGKGPDPMTGQTSHFDGHFKMIDNSTGEWEFGIWDAWKLSKTMEGKGTITRR